MFCFVFLWHLFFYLLNVLFCFGLLTVDILQIFILILLFFSLCTVSLSNAVIFELFISHIYVIILQAVNFQNWIQVYPDLFKSNYQLKVPCMADRHPKFNMCKVQLIVFFPKPVHPSLYSISVNGTRLHPSLTRTLVMFLFSCFTHPHVVSLFKAFFIYFLNIT